jgi:hypothetical protein
LIITEISDIIYLCFGGESMTEVALFILGCALGAPLGFSICALAAANGRKEAERTIRRLERESKKRKEE